MKEAKLRIGMNRRLFKKKLWEIFGEIDKLQTYRDPEKGRITGYQGIPTNYGSVCFHARFDEENLESYYPVYASDEEMSEIEEKKRADPNFNVFNYLVEKGLIYEGGPLPGIPGFILSYDVQVSLSMVGFTIECSGKIDEGIRKAEWQLKRLSLLKELFENPLDRGFIDSELSWEFMMFDDADETEEYGYSLVLTVEFPSDMTLEDTEREIDQKLAFLKPYINRMPRSDELFLR